MDNNKLKGKRTEAGLTQEEISKRLGMTSVSYNRKENGKREFTLSELNLLVEVLGLTCEEIKRIFFTNKLT